MSSVSITSDQGDPFGTGGSLHSTPSCDAFTMIRKLSSFSGFPSSSETCSVLPFNITPIERVHSLPASATLPDLLALARATGLEQFPLVDHAGNFVALVNVFEVLLEGAHKRQVSSYQRRIVTVTPEEEAYSIMKKMRAARATLAAVRQGGKGAIGIVGFDDLAALLVRVGEGKKAG